MISDYAALIEAVVGVVCPEPNESPIERAVLGVQLAVADLFIAITSAQTVDDALCIRRKIAPLTELLQVCESAALDKAEALGR